jgi:hypothetical protein
VHRTLERALERRNAPPACSPHERSDMRDCGVVLDVASGKHRDDACSRMPLRSSGLQATNRVARMSGAICGTCRFAQPMSVGESRDFRVRCSNGPISAQLCRRWNLLLHGNACRSPINASCRSCRCASRCVSPSSPGTPFRRRCNRGSSRASPCHPDFAARRFGFLRSLEAD